MILCVGEILTDMIGCDRGGALCYERKAGGAPFNVACAAKKLGAKVGFVGCVGDDIIGNYLIEFAKARGFDCLYIDRREDANTTLAFVELDSRGERSFCFYRKNTADYMLPEISEEIFAAADIVHIGSLMLSQAEGRGFASALMHRAHAAGKTVSFDVNFRSDIFRDEKSAVNIYKSFIEQSDVLKFSEDEVGIFGREYIDGLQDKLVCISLGSAGSEWRYCGKKGGAPTVKVEPIDTTGAGDAFYGGVLCGLDGLAKSEWTEQKLNEILAFANVCGALNTLGKGAIDFLPDRRAVYEKLGMN